MRKRVIRSAWVAASAWALCITGLFMSGCGERTNPVETERGAFELPQTYPYDFTSLDGAAIHEVPGRTSYVSLPPGYKVRGTGRPYPVLYLLHDIGFDQSQFEIYNLTTTAYNLMAQGEMEPMLIVTVDASNRFGLGMYANSTVCGNYEDMIAPELIVAIEKVYNVHTQAGRQARAIGGLGFGGQAALKLAIKHPELYSSASALNAPLAYAGDSGHTTEGVRGMLKYFFIEHGDSVVPGDYAAYAKVRPEPGTPVTNMLFAMSAAYSFNQDLEFLRPWTVRYSLFPTYTDTVYFDLPFDHRGYVEEPVWQRWMAHDVRNLFAANLHSLDNVGVYIDAAQQDEYGFQLQTALFVADLETAGTVNYESHTYSGTIALPADHGALVGTRLVQMLKFHAARLAQPAE